MIYQQKMPKMQPLVIKTKNLGFFARYKAWMFDRRRWMITEDWLYELRKNVYILIPAGFILDGASIPRIFWAILSPTGILLIPAIIHDYGYKFGYVWIKQTVNGVPFKYGEDFKRKYWDELFKKTAIKVNGFKYINKVAWLAVKVGGRRIWKKYRKITNPS